MNKTINDFKKLTYEEVINNIKKDNGNSFNYVIEKNSNIDSRKYIAIKDIHASVDTPITASSELLKGFVPHYDSHVVQALKNANYNIVGTLNMDEFAMGGANQNSAFGVVNNAIDSNAIAGGSSGGSAYAVKKGLIPVATGTDTGGSVRQPAALNGIFGYKPSYGLISRYGTYSFGSSFDTIGVLSNDLLDLQQVSSDLIVPNLNDQTSFVPKDFTLKFNEEKKLSDYKVCIVKEFEEINYDEHIKNEYENLKELLVNNGVEITEVSIDTIPLSLDLYVTLAYAEASSNLSRYDGIVFGNKEDGNDTSFVQTRNLFGKEVKKRLIIGTLMLQGENSREIFSQAQKIRHKMIMQFKEALSQNDIIISPSLNKSKISSKTDTASKEFYKSDILTIPANLTGMPSVSYPLKKDCIENPVGLQILADNYMDEKIFSFMNLLEKERND